MHEDLGHEWRGGRACREDDERARGEELDRWRLVSGRVCSSTVKGPPLWETLEARPAQRRDLTGVEVVRRTMTRGGSGLR